MYAYVRPARIEAFSNRDSLILTKQSKKVVTLLALLTLICGLLMLWFIKDVTIKVDGHSVKSYVFAGNVQKALNKSHVQISKDDLVTPPLNAPLKHNLEIKIKRAVPVQLVVDGSGKRVNSAGSTVADLIKKENIKIAKYDKVIPNQSTKITANMKINIIRVKYGNEIEEVQIPYSLERNIDNNIEVGFSKVAREGANGLEKQVYKITYENGKVVKREIIKRETVKEPISKIVAIGNLRVASRGGSSFNFQRAAHMTATGYTYTGHRTATGANPRRGIVAVDPRVIPLGSRLYIENYGYAVAADTGGAINGNIVDLFFETNNEAQSWGRRTVKVYILN